MSTIEGCQKALDKRRNDYVRDLIAQISPENARMTVDMILKACGSEWELSATRYNDAECPSIIATVPDYRLSVSTEDMQKVMKAGIAMFNMDHDPHDGDDDIRHNYQSNNYYVFMRKLKTEEDFKEFRTLAEIRGDGLLGLGYCVGYSQNFVITPGTHVQVQVLEWVKSVLTDDEITDRLNKAGYVSTSKSGVFVEKSKKRQFEEDEKFGKACPTCNIRPGKRQKTSGDGE